MPLTVRVLLLVPLALQDPLPRRLLLYWPSFLVFFLLLEISCMSASMSNGMNDPYDVEVLWRQLQRLPLQPTLKLHKRRAL